MPFHEALPLGDYSDMTEQDGHYANKDTGESVVFAVTESMGPLSYVNEEYVFDLYSIRHEDVAVTSFENGVIINDKEAFVAKVALTTPQGNEITTVLVTITDGMTDYMINFTHGANDTEGSLVKNLDAIIDSIVIDSMDVTLEDGAEEGVATDEQKEHMVEMLVEMFNLVNTDFNLMITILEENQLIEEGTELLEDLRTYTLILQEVHDGLSGETVTVADAEEFMDKIEATDQFIVETIATYLQ